MNSLRWVILLTLGAGCAASQKDLDGESADDPIAQVALRERRRLASVAQPLHSRSELPDAAAWPDDAEIEKAWRRGELTLGMEQSDVLSIWGQPRDVEIAGDPQAGNQRWIYFSGLSEQWKISARRVVYFEAGRVAGWEAH